MRRRRAGRLTRRAVLVATLFGVGRLPLAPGTWGSLAAVLALAPLLAAPWGFAAAMGVLGALAVWSAGEAAPALGGRDPGAIVIDEALGMGVAMAAVPSISPGWLFGAFVLFRLFDVLKPPPLRRLERLPGGLGIVADDLGAGVMAAGVLLAFALI